MNPENFCLVGSVINVFLWFLGTVNDHVPCGHDRIDSLVIEIKVCLSGGNIQNLEIKPSSRAVGRQLRTCKQMVCATASHDERLALVFKVNQ